MCEYEHYDDEDFFISEHLFDDKLHFIEAMHHLGDYNKFSGKYLNDLEKCIQLIETKIVSAPPFNLHYRTWGFSFYCFDYDISDNVEVSDITTRNINYRKYRYIS